MISERNVTLAVSIFLFAALSAALFLLPRWDVVLYPAFGLVFLWSDFRKEEETHIIFLFLATVAAFLLMTRGPDTAQHLGLSLEALGLWLLSLGLGFHRGRMSKERDAVLSIVENLDMTIRDQERELKFYEAYRNSAVAQIQLRRDMTQAAKSLGTTLDRQELELRLVRILEGRYKGSRIRILPGTPQDPLVAWSVKTQAPVLVKDLARDERFGALSPGPQPFRSALVVPLNVQRKPYGFLRMESGAPTAYGADDLRTVDLFTTIASLTLENIHLYEEVSSLATHDGLTQLFTQRAFRLRLKDELLRAGRSQSPLSLIMSDIDHFKGYNDTYGHQAGDELLRTVARILAAQTRPVDCVARYGGEEFALILPNTVHSHAVEIAERIRAATAAEPFVFQGRRTHVTMSLGVSSFPQDATSQSQLLRVADERLYRSKDGGRNQVTG